ncbi:YraN family protein [Streptomyces sp. NPDC097619]|uniref:YraN family protein n=1 Tax=Streptomyces sp. NPDC097619 TaxID=3157228 RepID=UPI003333685B
MDTTHTHTHTHTPPQERPATRTRTRVRTRGGTGTGPPGSGPPPTGGAARKALGRYGEDLAVRRLTSAGMTVLARNWRCRAGEIDILASDGDALVVCEVKTRRAGGWDHPMAALRPTQAARLRTLAGHWLAAHGGPPPGGVRIDLVGVLLPARGAARLEHVRGVA